MVIGVATLALGAGAFAVCLAVHVVWWRWRRPRRDIGALFSLFFGLPVALFGALAGALAGASAGWGDAAAQLPFAWLLDLALAAAYVQTYPASQAQSPTLVIMEALDRAGAEGLARAEIEALWNAGDLVDARVDDLLANRLLVPVGDGYALSAQAARLDLLFATYRRVLGLRDKGG